MQVETFECHETASEPIEASEEAIRLIEELGLNGQKQLIELAEEESPGRRNPYREMERDERFVYSILCPKQYALADYNRSPIPLRVLQVASHARQFFDEIVVWDRDSAETKDPVLVARQKTGDYGSYRYFILARWGSELEAFATLKRQALELAREKARAAWQEIADRVAGKLAKIDRMEMPELQSSDGTLNLPGTYWLS